MLAKEEPDFHKLTQMIRDGYCLNICGFDGYSVEHSLMHHYLDTSRPFGHEMVLYTLLTESEPENYPWNVYYREHADIYQGII